MVRIVPWREQVGNHPVTPVVIFREHRCAYSEGPEKRKENQPQQDCQSWLAIEHSGKARTLESALQFTVRSADSSSTNVALAGGFAPVAKSNAEHTDLFALGDDLSLSLRSRC